MVDNTEDIEVDVPQEELFDFIADPHNHLQFTPSLMDVSDVGENDVGKEGAYTFKMVGATLEGRFADTEFDRPTSRTYELTGDIEGTISWTVEAADGGSRVRYESSLDFPGPDLLDPITDPVIERFSQREVESILENLKVLLEERQVEA